MGSEPSVGLQQLGRASPVCSLTELMQYEVSFEDGNRYEIEAENRSSWVGKIILLVLCRPFQSDAQGDREAALVDARCSCCNS